VNWLPADILVIEKIEETKRLFRSSQ